MVGRGVLIICFIAPLLSGCIGGAAQSLPDAQRDLEPEEVLVRVFVDDLDGDMEDEIHIRLAGLADNTEVMPFDGRIEVLLKPGHGAGWIPKVWRRTIFEDQFIDAALPYYELTGGARGIEPGDEMHVSVEAELPDGRIIRGEYVTAA